MKHFLLALLLLLACGSAQAETTSNLITNTWNNVNTGTHPNNCCTGGSAPLYDPATNTIHFSYGLTAVHQVQAINQALSGSGVQINGWNWGYDLRNMNGVAGNQNGTDSIAVTSFITNSVGQIVQQSDQHYNTQFDWTRYAGTVNLNTPLSDAGSLGIQFVSRDDGYWAGYYGPQVRDVSLTANYTVDQCTVNPQSSPACPGFKTYYNMTDDGYAQVNLPFAFPFYGQLFTTSYMYTNGVVGFLNNNWGFCCDGTDLNNQTTQQNSPWNYAIYALNTDLIPGPNSSFYTENTDGGTGLRYTWNIVPEIGTDLNNTFHVQIKDTGYIGLTYDQVNLNQYRQPLIGIAGDISKGEYSQYWFGAARDLPNLAGTTLTFTGTEITDVCKINPLFNSSCIGYAEAYLAQQCSYNSLYDTSCPNYAAAYYTQQCSINSLYDPGCPGYAAAYLTYQCSLDPLYSTTCTGYAQAYFDLQCSIDGLYDKTCPNYEEAYALKYIVTDTKTTETPEKVATEITTTISNDGTVATKPSATGDSTVDKVITSKATASPSASPAAVVQLAPTPSTARVADVSASSPKEEKSSKEEVASNDTTNGTTENSGGSATAQTSQNSGDKKEQPKTARQELQERRVAAAKAKAVEEGKNLANKMGDAANMEQQVAIQNVVVAAMGFTPGFDNYRTVALIDAAGYKPFTVYNNQKNVDNRILGGRLFGGSDRLHSEMVESQYNQ